ncbi:hypothetical protein [Emticicia sp. C21]|uniref:hypothetical protein n=1 Tax=Emticicia sp. C21 TaxID=2302915 RepID=UPI000E35188B|nr:hypothetical protein [Emticicia sp. C21]RFS16038.1 hypothetical protein D0T08_14195 [Emticicia sp. C21]
MKSSISIKFSLLVLLPFAFFLNACKKEPENISPSLGNICLVAKRTKFDSQGKITYRETYTYNSKRQLASIKYDYAGANGTVTDTELYQYNSDGQITNKKSASNTTSYLYDRKLLIEENTVLGPITYLYKYSYNPDSKKSKLIFKSSRDNQVSLHYEETYYYKDTLLIRTINRNLPGGISAQVFDNAYKYDAQNRLIEKQTLRPDNSISETEKYEYGADRNVIKITVFVDNKYKESEEVFTYKNNKLVEKTESTFNSKGEIAYSYKTVFEYRQDNISKMTLFRNGTLTSYEQYTYTCDK